MTGHSQSPWSDPLSFKDKSFKTHNISKCQQQMLQNIKDSVSPIECNSRIRNLMQEQNWMNSEKTFCLTQHHRCIDHFAWELVRSWSISHLVLQHTKKWIWKLFEGGGDFYDFDFFMMSADSLGIITIERNAHWKTMPLSKTHTYIQFTAVSS